jgi:homeobox protein cut-like
MFTNPIDIDLTHLQKSLDSVAGDIVNGQRESLVERKELAQKTKEYRKLDDEQKKEEWKGLLKCKRSVEEKAMPKSR